MQTQTLPTSELITVNILIRNSYVKSLKLTLCDQVPDYHTTFPQTAGNVLNDGEECGLGSDNLGERRGSLGRANDRMQLCSEE